MPWSSGDEIEELSDAELIERIDGTTDAFAKLYRRHADAVAQVVNRSILDRDRADDLVQEVFFRALTKLENLRDPNRFRQWRLCDRLSPDPQIELIELTHGVAWLDLGTLASGRHRDS